MIDDRDEEIVSVNLSRHSLDTLVKAMNVYAVHSAKKEKRPTLDEHKSLRRYLKRKRDADIHPILLRMINS